MLSNSNLGQNLTENILQRFHPFPKLLSFQRLLMSSDKCKKLMSTKSQQNAKAKKNIEGKENSQQTE